MKGSSMPSQVPSFVLRDKGSRYKRKNRANPLMGDIHRIARSNGNESEKFETVPSDFGPSDGRCGVNRGHSDALKPAGSFVVGTSQSREELEADKLEDFGWSEFSEAELIELVLSNLDTIFGIAIRKIVASGYTEEIATEAVLRSALRYGCIDSVSNIVTNALSFLESGAEVASATNGYCENLQQLEKYILAELVFILKEIRPLFSTGDALWWLLICDMNLSVACGMGIDPVNGFVNVGTPIGSSAVIMPPQNAAEVKGIADAFTTSWQSAQSDTTIIAEASSTTKLKASPIFHRRVREKDGRHDALDKQFVCGTSPLPYLEEKFISSKKVQSSFSKAELLRLKSLNQEKTYRTYESKGSSKARKLGGLGGSFLYKKLTSVSESSTVSIKTASLRINNAMGINMPQDSKTQYPSVHAGSFSPAAYHVETSNSIYTLKKPEISSLSSTMNCPSAFPVVSARTSLSAHDTELSSQLPVKINSATASSRCNTDAPDCSSDGNPQDKSLDQWIVQYGQDETILKLISRATKLQKHLQDWTEWTNQRVMQAARCLSKDKDELKTLRQEKKEVERLQNNKQALEENTTRKVAEMENALSKASTQMEGANAAVVRLQVENAMLKKELVAAKIHAVESDVSCQEIAEREKKSLIDCKSWEKQKAMLQEDLRTERGKVTELLQELEQAKVLMEKFESRWKQEDNAKNELLRQASSLEKEREQIEALTKLKEGMIKSKSDKNIQKCKDDIEQVERAILQLRLKSDSSRIAAMKQGIDGSYANKLLDTKSNKAHKTPAVSPEYSEIGGIKRERECVMCLSEEMSVVFLPCAHQVVCKACNELHEKQGMKNCPSCRSPIQRRISVRYARS